MRSTQVELELFDKFGGSGAKTFLLWIYLKEGELIGFDGDSDIGPER